MPSQLIINQDILRYIHRATDDEQYLPQLNPGYVDIYKGEIVVNHSKDRPALYIRAGAGHLESVTNDVLVRIGNIFVADEDPLLDVDDLDKQGLAWYNTNNEHFYINDGSKWIQLTNDLATETVLGLTKKATYAETILGFEEFSYVTPQNLRRWAEYQSYIRRVRHTATIYVDALLGDDSLENDGSDPTYPLLSIERAILETLRRPINVIKVQPGEYFIDNRPGVTSLDSIKPVTYRDEQDNPVGPINPVGSWVVTEVFIEGHSGSINIESVQVEENIYRGQQLFFEKDGAIVGSAIVDIRDDVLATTSIPVRYARGFIEPGSFIRVARYSSFNADNSGVIIPPDCNFIAEGDVVLRPRFITYYNSIEESARSYLFKVTQRIQFKGFTFRDGVQKVTHHMFSLITNATQEDLQTDPVHYFQKVSRGLGIKAGIDDSVTKQTRLPWLQLDDCMLDSRYGINFMTLGGSFYEDMKDITITNFVCIVTREDPQLYETIEGAPGEDSVTTIISGVDNWVVRIDAGDYRVMFNGGYTKYVPLFSVVDSDTQAIVSVGNHLVLDDVHPPLFTDVTA